MKLKGLNICSFDPYDDFGLPKGTRYRQHNNPFISFGGPVSLDTHAENAASNGTTLAITIGNNKNRLLVVSVYYGRTKAAGYAISGITLGSQNLTKLTSLEGDGSSFGNYQDVWYLIAPNTGAGTITISTTGSPTYFGLSATSWYNVDQSTGIASATKSSASGSVPSTYSLAITPTTTGSSIVCCLTSETTTVTTPNNTGIYLSSNNGEGRDAACQWLLSPTIGGSNTFTWSDSAGANSTVGYVMIAFEILVG